MPKIVDKDAKRLELVKAATEVFARDGFAATKMADVAVAAGVGKGTIYEYFDTKTDLFWAVCKNLVAWPDDADEFKEDPEAGFARLVRTLVKSYEASNAFFLVLIDYWAAMIVGKSQRQKVAIRHAEELYARPRQLIGTVVEAGQRSGEFRTDVDPGIISALAIAGIEGLRLQRVQDPAHVDFDGCIDALVESLSSYLRKE